MELSRLLRGEQSAGAAVSKDRRVLLLGVDVAGAESGLIWRVSRVVLGVSGRLSASAVPARGRSQSLIGLRDEALVEASGRHGLGGVVKLGLLENIARLLGESLLKKRVGSNHRSIALIAGNHAVLAFNGLKLREKSDVVLTYSVGHVVVGSPIHVIVRPVEELALRDGGGSSVLHGVKFALGRPHKGVEKGRAVIRR